jgi:2-dehydro-3-deoxygluconokinase
MNAKLFNKNENSKVSPVGRDLTGAVFCFGELLLRLSPESGGKWIQESAMPVYIGGAELNVATALAGWGIPARYCTALPDNFLSREICEELKQKNIDISAIHFSGNRIGIYYLPQGADVKHAGVIYDRAHSSFSELKPGMIDWKKVLKDCSWFHFSSISPALNENVASVCKEALDKASELGVTVSVDLNYRSKLWQYGKKPVDVMKDLMPHCHVVMGNLWSAEQLLGIESPLKDSTGKTQDELLEAAALSMKQIQIAYPQAAAIAYTFRLEQKYFAVLQQGSNRYVSEEYSIATIVDKVGSGDCFMAALIYGLNRNFSPKEVIDFSAAAAVGKLSEKGDSTHQSADDIMKKVKAWEKMKI